MSVQGIQKIELARGVAFGAHCALQQERKGNKEAYFRHPERVANKVREVMNRVEDLPHPLIYDATAAAWLHDVVEDTPITREQIQDMFGEDTSILVNALTKPVSNCSREQRKIIQRAKIIDLEGVLGNMAAVIKLCDLQDNIKTAAECEEFSTSFLNMYFRESEELLDALTLKISNTPFEDTVHDVVADIWSVLQPKSIHRKYVELREKLEKVVDKDGKRVL